MADDDGYDERFDDEFDDELDDEEGAPKKKKRVATSTKIVLVVAGWLLLTLFLIGEFSEDETPDGDSVSAQLDTVEGEDAELEEEEEFSFDEEAALESFDADGDGLLSDTERAAAVEAYEEAVASGEVAIGEPWKGVTGGTASATDEGVGESAAPGAGPTSGGSGTSSGSGSGSTGATTTTAASGGGGGGGSSTTTTAKAGSATTTVKPTTTTGPTTTAPPPPPPTTEVPGDPVALNVSASALMYQYPTGYTRNLTLPPGSTITFKNNEGSANIDHSFTIKDGWSSGELDKHDPAETSPALTPGSYTFGCTAHPSTMNGTITVT